MSRKQICTLTDAELADPEFVRAYIESHLDSYDCAMREVVRWKSAHDGMRDRCSILRQRPDLPVERIPAYEALIKAQDKALENEGMAECMVDARAALIEEGIIDKSIPPMFVAEAVINAFLGTRGVPAQAGTLVGCGDVQTREVAPSRPETRGATISRSTAAEGMWMGGGE